MGIPLVIADFTGRYQRSLRRYVSGAWDQCPDHGYHNAIADTEVIGEDQIAKAAGDNWPHDDPRWPAKCSCGYEFADSDQWQRNESRIFRMPDGTEFTFWGSFGSAAPPGAMIRADWYDSFSSHPDGIEAWIIALPDGGEWITSQKSSDGGYWTVTGTPPNITVSPSIFHNSPHGWHGYVRDGELVGV